MKKLTIYTVDAFTGELFEGNPAGVVPGADDLTVREMENIARELNLSETAFLLKSSKAHFRLRYFTPRTEVDFCGHATIAAASVIRKTVKGIKKEFTLETNIGCITIRFDGDTAVMTQAEPKVKAYPGDISALFKLAGLTYGDYDARYPVKLAYTGNWHLLLPVLSRDAIDRAEPLFEKLGEHNRKLGVTTTHLFTFDTWDADIRVYTRDFAPAVGVNEDPVTGSANGALAGYLALEGIFPRSDGYIILQGNALNRFGRLFVKTEEKETLTVHVGGKAVTVLKGEISFA